MSPSATDPHIKRIYLSGAITGVEGWQEIFQDAATALRIRGLEVFNPGEHQDPDAPIIGAEAYKHYMALELPEVIAADAVVVLDGWKDSRGARLEVHTAVVCGIPVLSYPDLHILDVEHFLLQKLSYADGTGLLRPVTEERTVVGRSTEIRMLPDGDGGMVSMDTTVVDSWEPEPEPEKAFAPFAFQKEFWDGGQRIVTNTVTGGQKETRAARFDLLPWDQLWKVAELYAYGANKYEDRNWERGYAFSLSIAALMRHMAKFVQGEDDDPESGCPHMASVVFHALALMRFVDATNLDHSLAELDDRPVGKRVRAREDAA